MIHDQVEFHNIAELREEPGSEGLRLQRVPEDVRLAINDKAKIRMLSPTCGEIRFVSEGNGIEVILSCPEGEAKVNPFWGLFQGKESFTVGREPVTIRLLYPERLAAMKPEAAAGMPFSPRVWRLLLSGTRLHYHGIRGVGLRPPLPEELPSLRYIAYGTSITHGSAATGPHLCYVSQTARNLGADLINLGVGGSCYCEPEMADHIAARSDWHVATLALSVNMLSTGFTVSEFRERTEYLVKKVCSSHPDKPVAVITLYPFFGDHHISGPLPAWKATSDEYRETLREVVLGCGCANAHLIEGPEILDNISGLTEDLLHPADNGMIRMGARLAARLKELL